MMIAPRWRCSGDDTGYRVLFCWRINLRQERAVNVNASDRHLVAGLYFGA